MAIAERLAALRSKWGLVAVQYGPAHVVVEDGNVDDASIEGSIEGCEGGGLYDDLEIEETRAFLEWLRGRPLEEREAWWEEERRRPYSAG